MPLIDDLRNDKLVQRYVSDVERSGIANARRLHNGNLPPITQPWQVLAEQRINALNILDNPSVLQEIKSNARALVALLLGATPFLWTDAMYRTAVASPLPSHTIGYRGMLPLPAMYWSFENMIDWGSVGGYMQVDSMLIADGGEDGIMFFLFGMNDHGYMVGGGAIPYGGQYPDVLPTISLAHELLKMLTFMGSRYVVTAKQRLSRPEVRHEWVDYTEHQEAAPEICVITLRTPVYLGERKLPRPEDGTGAIWSHRWMVRGHYRNQWRPSTQGHHLTWIPAYIKGPGDKPFHAPVYHVKQ